VGVQKDNTMRVEVLLFTYQSGGSVALSKCLKKEIIGWGAVGLGKGSYLQGEQ